MCRRAGNGAPSLPAPGSSKVCSRRMRLCRQPRWNRERILPLLAIRSFRSDARHGSLPQDTLPGGNRRRCSGTRRSEDQRIAICLLFIFTRNKLDAVDWADRRTQSAHATHFAFPFPSSAFGAFPATAESATSPPDALHRDLVGVHGRVLERENHCPSDRLHAADVFDRAIENLDVDQHYLLAPIASGDRAEIARRRARRTGSMPAIRRTDYPPSVQYFMTRTTFTTPARIALCHCPGRTPAVLQNQESLRRSDDV